VVSRLVILALRALLVLIALGAVGLQVVLAVVIATQVTAPDVGVLAATYSALGIAAVACVEVALVEDRAAPHHRQQHPQRDERAFRWVDVISVAGLVAALLVAALCAHAGEIDDAPGLVLIGGGIGLSGVAFALLMVVMRGLLRTATVFRRELDEVV
jgi:hypothetical protein